VFKVGEQADILILHTDDETYATFSEADFPGLRLVFDGRNKFQDDQFGKTPVLGLGRGVDKSGTT